MRRLEENPRKGVAMTVGELERRQHELGPKDDLTPYGGQWVALRDGHVVGHDVDPTRLRAQEGITDADAIVPVAPPGSGAFIH